MAGAIKRPLFSSRSLRSGSTSTSSISKTAPELFVQVREGYYAQEP